MAGNEKSYFELLNDIDVSGKTENKGNLTYLSWCWAWGELKKRFPDANYTIYEHETNAGPVNYFTDGMTCWVKTGVTVNGIEHIEYLPVMDNKNQSIPLAGVQSTDVNKAIQRSITKAIARHGLGLYVYAGEDLPEVKREAKIEEAIKENEKTQKEEFDKMKAKAKAGDPEIKKDKPATVVNTDKLPWG
jgi:hypothetical protein